MPLIKDVPAGELSPYLRQHQSNPVDWYPWGDDAFDKARRENRPVFLSIGYSACHWCHVMAHESFEDPVTAAALNSSFVSIKVDREERPDVDAVYMEAVQAITGSGGWPMSMFLTPDGRPFFGGTYFPPDDRRGTPSFRTVLGALADVWDNRHDEVEEQAAELSAAIASRSVVHAPPGATSLFANAGDADHAGPAGRPDLLTPALEDLSLRFDPEWGGFGGAPKFPQPALVDLALCHSMRMRGDPVGERSELMATRTLDGMAAGGIHDHLGGGFARYSTDNEWLVPHFEKMLYDQAGLLRAFLHGWQVTGRANYRWAMDGIVDYVGRDLTNSAGGVCSAEDADSEAVEGRFYVWSRQQIAEAVDRSIVRRRIPRRSVLSGHRVVRSDRRRQLRGRLRPSPTDRGAAARAAGRGDRQSLAVRGSHLPGQTRPRRQGPHRVECHVRVGAGRGGGGHRRPGLEGCRSGHRGVPLCQPARQRRPVAAKLAAGGRRPSPGLRQRLCLVDRLLHTARRAHRTSLVDRSRRNGAPKDCWRCFTTTSRGASSPPGVDAEALIVRAKEIFDGATPSANAVAALSLARLGAITGNEQYTEAARAEWWTCSASS